jgi:hypothetical protein
LNPPEIPRDIITQELQLKVCKNKDIRLLFIELKLKHPTLLVFEHLLKSRSINSVALEIAEEIPKDITACRINGQIISPVEIMIHLSSTEVIS